MAMIESLESLIHTNYCALCDKPINQDKEYCCLSIAATSEYDNRIHMEKPMYGYLCVKCANKLVNLFDENNEEISTKQMNDNESCWQTGNYTDQCDCETCNHKEECSGYDKDD